jgi:hypothetical protein
VPTSRPAGDLGADEAFARVPLVVDRDGGAGHRLAQLADAPGWHDALRSLRATDRPEEHLGRTDDVAAAAARRYLTHGHADGVMLVHAITAPTAVRRAMPAVARHHWEVSADFAWVASAALVAAYAAGEPRHDDVADLDPAELMARAVDHGDEHVIKLADAVLEGVRAER